MTEDNSQDNPTRWEFVTSPKNDDDVYFLDENGFNWKFDGHRVFCIEAEGEMLYTNPELVEENGYGCSELDEALEILEQGGYNPIKMYTLVMEKK